MSLLFRSVSPDAADARMSFLRLKTSRVHVVKIPKMTVFVIPNHAGMSTPLHLLSVAGKRTFRTRARFQNLHAEINK